MIGRANLSNTEKGQGQTRGKVCLIFLFKFVRGLLLL